VSEVENWLTVLNRPIAPPKLVEIQEDGERCKIIFTSTQFSNKAIEKFKCSQSEIEPFSTTTKKKSDKDNNVFVFFAAKPSEADIFKAVVKIQSFSRGVHQRVFVRSALRTIQSYINQVQVPVVRDLSLQVKIIPLESIFTPTLQVEFTSESSVVRRVLVQWYRSEHPIPNATTFQYMPTADDFGQLVEARITPILINGQPGRSAGVAEKIGVDPQTQTRVSAALERGSEKFFVRFVEGETESELTISKTQIAISEQHGSRKGKGFTWPVKDVVVSLDVTNPLVFTISPSKTTNEDVNEEPSDDWELMESELSLKTESPLLRDVICCCVRAFATTSTTTLRK
jgi:hypothetical protein